VRRAPSGKLSRAAVFVAIAPLLLPIACGRSDDRTSDIAIHDAIALLRNESGPATTGRRLRLAALMQLPTRTTVAGQAQSTCGEAYRQLLDAEDEIYFAELRMKAAGAYPGSLAADVARAEKLLEAAKAAMPACDAAAARLAIAAR
jgi:hypothetical protein